MELALEYLKPLIELYAGSQGWLVQIVAVVGTLRLIDKPLMEIIEAVVKATPSKSDDELPSKIKASKAYKILRFALDYLASIKLKK